MDRELVIVKLRQKILSLETKNNLLQLKHSQLKDLASKNTLKEELDVMKSKIKFLEEDLKKEKQYSQHLERLLEFFVYKRKEFRYSQVGDNSLE